MARTWRLALALVLAFTMLGAVGVTTPQNAGAAYTYVETDNFALAVTGASAAGTVKWYVDGNIKRGEFKAIVTLGRRGCVKVFFQFCNVRWTGNTQTRCGIARDRFVIEWGYSGRTVTNASIDLTFRPDGGSWGRADTALSHTGMPDKRRWYLKSNSKDNPAVTRPNVDG